VSQGTGATLTLGGGNFNLLGNSAAGTTESLGNVVSGLNGTSNATTTVTMANTTGLFTGMVVTGAGIPTGTTISAITPNTNITLSNAATSSVTQPLVFASGGTNTLAVGGSTVTLTPNAAAKPRPTTRVRSPTSTQARLSSCAAPTLAPLPERAWPTISLTAAPTSIGGGISLAAGTWSAASTAVTVTSTTGLFPGMTVSGTGIPAGTTVAAITGATTFTLSAPATAAGSDLAITATGGPLRSGSS